MLRLFSIQHRAVGSLAEPLLSANLFKDVPPPPTTPDAQLVTLPNGVRVVSIARPTPFVSVGVAVEAGSRFETHESGGAAYFFANTFMKSTQSRSSLRVTRALEALSPDVSAQATRNLLLYRVTTGREKASDAIAQLVDLTSPAIRQWEAEDARSYIDIVAKQHLSDARIADDLLHAAAFRGLGYGRPVIPHRDPAAIEDATLVQYAKDNFVGSRIIVAVSGLDSADAVAAATAATAGVVPNGTPAAAPSAYVGGERFLEVPSGVTHFSIALSAAGISRAAAAVLVAVLGRQEAYGSWRSVGGGGRLTKLSTGTLHSAGSFYTGPGPAALIGFRGVTGSPSPAAKLALARSLLESLVDPLDSQTLQGAKNRAVNDLLTLYASRDVVPFIAEQVANNGGLSATALVSEIQAITAADIVAAVKKMRSTPISVGAVGNVGGL